MSETNRVQGAECPFCPTNGLVIEGTARKGYHVTCCSCLAQGPCVHSKEEALEGWNSRFVPRLNLLSDGERVGK